MNITGPQRIAKVCKEMGVQRLVHMSHVNAREEPEVVFLKGGSRFLSTKYQGELAVKSEFPEATIFRCYHQTQSGSFDLIYVGALMYTVRETALSTTGSLSGGNQRPPVHTSACLAGQV